MGAVVGGAVVVGDAVVEDGTVDDGTVDAGTVVETGALVDEGADVVVSPHPAISALPIAMITARRNLDTAHPLFETQGRYPRRGAYRDQGPESS